LAAVSTAPNISCSIVVTYKSGASNAQGLTAKRSDAAGAVTWTWTIGGNTTAGTWPIDVTCGGARGHATFIVQ
jgi:micrococcal nuclease